MSDSTHIDRNGDSFSGAGIVIENRAFAAEAETDDVLKFSAAVAARICGQVSATGGDENACDANNRSSVIVEGTLRLIGGDQAGLVVKGGSSFGTAVGGLILIQPSPFSLTDLLVDDWSDQNQSRSTVAGRIVRLDGEPLRVVFGRWRRPRIDGPVRVVWTWTIALHLYNPLKAIVRKILRIPAGAKGPSWL